jgi:hypothetical protein
MIFLLAALLGAPPAEVRPELTELLQIHCAGCHDEDAPGDLDLRTPPAVADAEVWLAMLEQVESFRMPPPEKGGEIEDHFPIDPAQRRALVEALLEVAGPAASAPALPLRLPPEAWLQAVREIALPILGEEPLAALLAPAAVRIDADRAVLVPVQQIAFEDAAYAVCEAMLARELKLAADQRRLLVAAFDGRGVPAIAERLFEVVYRRLPSEGERSELFALMSNHRQALGRWDRAWVATCQTQLSGLDLLYPQLVGAH